MSKKRRPRRNAGHVTSHAGQRPSSRTWVAVVLAGVVAMTAVWYWRSRDAPLAPAAESTLAAVLTNAATAGVDRPKATFQTIAGRWRRSDGGYVLEIKSVTDAGAIDAAYFNPRPIHVANAQASSDAAIIKVFVELRDVNYPGSTYTLAYDAASDELRGIYYQAVQKENFDVVFVRSR